MSTSSPSLLTTAQRPRDRLISLDQFRGYTVAAMLLVNFLGSFAVCPHILRHSHDHLSYADTIMPQFLFAVGFSFRLTFGRREQLGGTAAAYARLARRLLGLVLVSLVIYQVGAPVETWEQFAGKGFQAVIREPLKRTWFQTLMHIAVTSLWLLPVIRSSATVRVAWMIASAAAHVLLSYEFNFEWVNLPPRGIDGGPFGFLTWTIPATVGTLACDAVLAGGGRPNIGRLIAWSGVLMLLGYALSCGTRLYDVSPTDVEARRAGFLADDPVLPPADQVVQRVKHSEWRTLLAEPPFVPPPDQRFRKWNYWMMSQRAATLSYLSFAAGFSLAVFVLFHIACDRHGLQLAFFRTFGTNALAAYVLHELVSSAVKPFVPKDSPAWYVWIALFVFFAITWLIVRHLEKQNVYLRL